MKIIISEQQLKRIIKEFQRDLYSEGVEYLATTIGKEIKKYNDGLDMGGNQSLPILEMIKERSRNFLKEYFNKEEGKIVNKINNIIDKKFILKGDKIILQTQVLAPGAWDPILGHGYYGYDRVVVEIIKGGGEIIEYRFIPDIFIKALGEIIVRLESSLNKKEKSDLQLDLDISKSKYAPSYSGEKLKDELEKRIYDWEYTKTILENIISEYINNQQYISRELYNKIMDENVINIMMERMDEVMKNNDYNVFRLIKQDNWRKDFNNFLKSYTTYYKQTFKGNEEQFYQDMKVDKKLPPEILFGRMLWDMTYWINK